MAETDGGGLLVQIGVTQARMERELAKLTKDAAKSAGDMEKSFQAANNNIGKGANNAFGGAAKGATQATGAIKNTSFATSNLASQLNDIGVQLAGGQSPFLIMLQQGTQISQIFNQTGGSIRGFGSILAGAVTSVLNPFSLLTFAIIGAGGYAVQYFSDLVSSGEESNKKIKEQAQLVESVAKAWGDAVPALQNYVDQLERAKSVAELQQVVGQRNADEMAKVQQAVAGFTDEYDQYTTILRAAANATGEQRTVLSDLGTKYAELEVKVKNGTATVEDFQAVQAVATSVAATSGFEEIATFASAFDILTKSVLESLAAITRLNAQAGPAIATKFPTRGVYPGVDRSTDGNIQNGGFTTPERGPMPEGRPPIELEGLPGQFNADGTLKGKRGGGGRGANAYKSEVESIRERTAALRESTAAQAAVNPLVSDYGFALEKAKAEQKLLADAQRAGMAITPALREQISELAGSYAQASADAKRLSESQGEVKKQAEAWAALEKDVFGGFIKDLKDSKSGAEALSNALNKIADKLLDMALDGLFSTKGATSGGGSGLFGSILSGIGKIFGFSSGTANTGGNRGQARGVVHGQEAVIPLPAGGKVPVQLNAPSSAAMQRAPSRDVVELRLADDSGRMADIADQRIRTASGTIVKISVDQSYKTVKSNMPNLMTDAQSRNFS